MSVITKQRWLSPDSYVEVRVEPNWGARHDCHCKCAKVDVLIFTRDPRKLHYHKPKFRSRTSSHGWIIEGEGVNPIALSNNLFGSNGNYRKYALAAREMFKEIRLTSSASRAAA